MKEDCIHDTKRLTSSFIEKATLERGVAVWAVSTCCAKEANFGTEMSCSNTCRFEEKPRTATCVCHTANITIHKK
jgi:hypothetical protein